MDATNFLESLMRLSFSEIQELPATKTTEATDAAGERIQTVTWCEKLAPDRYRVVVSVHRVRPLGVSFLALADGFTINASGETKRLDRTEVEELFL